MNSIIYSCGDCFLFIIKLRIDQCQLSVAFSVLRFLRCACSASLGGLMEAAGYSWRCCMWILCIAVLSVKCNVVHREYVAHSEDCVHFPWTCQWGFRVCGGWEGKQQRYPVTKEKCTKKVLLSSLGCSATWDHWEWGSFGEITIGLIGQVLPSETKFILSEDRRTRGRRVWGSCIFKTVLVIPNFIMKVYSTELHLQKESWHVVEIITRNCKCYQVKCWFLSNAVYSDR